MRCDHVMGLPGDALIFLKENEVIPDPCPTCNRPFQSNQTECSSFEGYEEHPLFEYELKNELTANEEVQTMGASGGPMFFLQLHVSNGRLFKWTEEEIEKHLS